MSRSDDLRLLDILDASGRVGRIVARGRDALRDDVRRLPIPLAHHYHRVDADQVWSIAAIDVPALAEATRATRPDLEERALSKQGAAGNPGRFTAPRESALDVTRGVELDSGRCRPRREQG